MNELHIEMELRIRKDVFNQDFLDIEVNKRYSIYGDDLMNRFKEHYKEDAEKHGDLFTDKYIYDCRGIANGKVLLLGHRVNWK